MKLKVKLITGLIVLVALLSGAVLQAQGLDRPEILTVTNSRIISNAFVRFSTVPGAVRYEVFIRGFNKEWSTKKEGGKGGWYLFDAISTSAATGWRNFSDLPPGSWYHFRVRAIDAEGSVSKVSRKFKAAMPPCWVWARFNATGARWTEEHTKDPFTPPPEWEHVKNTINCE